MARRKDEVACADPTLLILGSLADGPKHGYAIVQDTEQAAGGHDRTGHVVRCPGPVGGTGLCPCTTGGRPPSALRHHTQRVEGVGAAAHRNEEVRRRRSLPAPNAQHVDHTILLPRRKPHLLKRHYHLA
jgi:hypothetical protein